MWILIMKIAYNAKLLLEKEIVVGSKGGGGGAFKNHKPLAKKHVFLTWSCIRELIFIYWAFSVRWNRFFAERYLRRLGQIIVFACGKKYNRQRSLPQEIFMQMFRDRYPPPTPIAAPFSILVSARTPSLVSRHFSCCMFVERVFTPEEQRAFCLARVAYTMQISESTI